MVGHEACRSALTDPTLSKSWTHASPALPLARLSAGDNLLSSNPPDHTRLRKLVVKEFTPRRIEGLAPRVRALTGELLDVMLARPDGRADLVEALSFPLAMGNICELLGVPSLDRAAFRDWAEQALSSPDRDTRTAATAAMTHYLVGMVDEKRKQPGDDLISALIRTTDEDGDRLSPDELIGMAWLLLVTGFETTVNLISNGVLRCSSTPTNSPRCAPTPRSSTTPSRRCSATTAPSRPPPTASPPSPSRSPARRYLEAANWS